MSATGGVQMVGRKVSMVSRMGKVSEGIIAHLAHHVPPALILVGKTIMKNMIVHHMMKGSMKTIGGFQLVDLIITELKDHMTCCKFKCSHWWKIYL